MRTSVLTGACAGFALILATACGGGGAATSRPATAGTSAAPASAAASVAGGMTCSPTLGTGQQVAIQGFAFKPNALPIAAGTSVSWTNGDTTAHTVTFKDGGPDCGNLNTGGSATIVFSAPGTYNYFCKIHPNMTGTVTVS